MNIIQQVHCNSSLSWLTVNKSRLRPKHKHARTHTHTRTCHHKLHTKIFYNYDDDDDDDDNDDDDDEYSAWSRSYGYTAKPPAVLRPVLRYPSWGYVACLTQFAGRALTAFQGGTQITFTCWPSASYINSNSMFGLTE